MISIAKNSLAVLAVLIGTQQFASAQVTSNFPHIGKVVTSDPALSDLIDPNAKIEVLASGFMWTEGPIWISEKDGPGYLLFSEIPRNAINKWSEKEGLSVFMKPAGYTGVTNYGYEPGSNGLAQDASGQLVICEHGDRRISVLTHEGGKVTIADKFDGKRLNSPNDVIVKSNGEVYFTDPPYGLRQGDTDPLKEIDFCGVYRVTKSGEVKLLTKDLPRPNGIAFSPDEKILYVPQSDGAEPFLMAYELDEQGDIKSGKVLYDFRAETSQGKGLPDGMDVDKDGNLFVTGPGGVTVMTKDGKKLGLISTGEAISNCAFGGDYLYLTSDMYICRIKTKTSK